MKIWLLYFSSAGQPSSSDKMKDKGSPAKVMDRSGQVGSSPKTSSKKKKGKGKDSGTSSEEERWLDAIESGKLEEVSSSISSYMYVLI
jgi:INO80 complex subunit B